MTAGDKPDEEMTELEQAKQLLRLTDLVDRYPQVVGRRIVGITYVLIAGGISFATLLLFGITSIIQEPIEDLSLHLIFIAVSLIVTWVLAFRVVSVIAKSYSSTTDPSGMTIPQIVFWVIFTIVIFASSYFGVVLVQPLLFPISVQLMISTIFIANYYSDQDEPRTVTKEHLYLALVALLSIAFMFIFERIWPLIIIVVDVGGIYILGIYFLITAEQALLKNEDR